MIKIGTFGFIFLGALAAFLSGCNTTDSGTASPPSLESQVTGTWVASSTLPAQPTNHILGLQMDNQSNKSFVRTGKFDGTLIMRQSGTWYVSGDKFITTAIQCEEADPTVNPSDSSITWSPLNVRACQNPTESSTINIQANAWTLNDVDPSSGQVETFQFSKL